jgi:hypothetical protein
LFLPKYNNRRIGLMYSIISCNINVKKTLLKKKYSAAKKNWKKISIPNSIFSKNKLMKSILG